MELEKIKNEAQISSFLFKKATSARIPLGGTFELSPVCNFSCKMCYVRKTQKEVSESSRSIMTCKQWLELAEELREEGMLYLLLTGGEPFLWPDFWELYTKLHEMGFLISINTNGSLINEKAIEQLKKYPPTRINLTLYGASDETYESLCGIKGVFHKVDKAIRGLKEAKIAVKLNCSLTPENAGDLEKIVSYAKEQELLLDVATYMFPPLRRDTSMVGQNERFTPEESAFYNLERYRLQYGEEMYVQYLERLSAGLIPPPGLEESCVDPVDGKIMCRAAKSSFWITWDGYMAPCGMMYEPKIDITTQKFKEGWKQLVKIGEELICSGVCTTCLNHKICHSCAAVAQAETGKVSGIPVYLCEQMTAARKLAEKELSLRKNKEGTET